MQIEILSPARKHGVADEHILHALRNAVFDYPDQGDHWEQAWSQLFDATCGPPAAA